MPQYPNRNAAFKVLARSFFVDPMTDDYIEKYFISAFISLVEGRKKIRPSKDEERAYRNLKSIARSLNIWPITEEKIHLQKVKERLGAPKAALQYYKYAMFKRPTLKIRAIGGK